MAGPEDERVNQRFKEWQRCRAQLRDLRDGLEPEAQGEGATSASDRTTLQRECDGLLVLVLEAMSHRAAMRDPLHRAMDAREGGRAG